MSRGVFFMRFHFANAGHLKFTKPLLHTEDAINKDNKSGFVFDYNA